MKSKILGFLIIGLLGTGANVFPNAAIAASVNALTFDVTFNNSSSFDSTRGYAFNVTQSGVYVTALSVWDSSGDGLGAGHSIGLWDPAGNLIASASIASGTSAPLLGQFRYVDIGDLLLPIGDGYLVGATFLERDPDPQAIFANPATATGIAYVGTRYAENSSTGVLTRPTSTASFLGLPGGSLLVELRSVPEPGSLALLGLGLAGLGVARRRKVN